MYAIRSYYGHDNAAGGDDFPVHLNFVRGENMGLALDAVYPELGIPFHRIMGRNNFA